MSQYRELTIPQLSHAFSTGEISPVDVVQETLTAAQKATALYNAFVDFDEDGALEAARESEARWRSGEARGILDGVPLPIKDTHKVKGWRGPWQGSLLEDGEEVATVDGPLVSQFRAAGAVLFGRTLACEWGWKGIGDSPRFGPARNPWNPDHTPGGSSAGAVVSVASGVTRIAGGGDGGGSIRIPANFCGVFGLKTTAHRTPTLYPMTGDMPNQGVITRTAEETAAVFDILTARYPKDSFQVPFQPLGELNRSVKGMRIGVTHDFGFPGIDPEVAAAVEQAAAVLAELGAEIVPLELDFSMYLNSLEVIWSAGFQSILGDLDDEKRAVMDPGLVEVVDRADSLSAKDLQHALMDKGRLSDAFRDVELDVDLTLSCTSLVLPPEIGSDVPVGSGMSNWFEWSGPTWISNMARRPGASIPVSLSASGLPIGVQLTGQIMGERSLLGASAVLEKEIGFDRFKKPLI